MQRFGPGWGWQRGFDVLLEGEGGGGVGAGAGGEKDAAYWQAEAKKAFEVRDAAKREMRELTESGRVLTPEQKKRFEDLEKAEAKAAEDQKRAEGRFDELKTELVTKHTAELQTRDTRISELETIIADREIDLAFANAVIDKTPLFGGDDAFTVLTPSIAAGAFRRHIVVEHIEADGRKLAVVRVKNPQTGKVILGSDGNPAPFAKAMVELINTLPDKNRILRGSGKAGSGSSGGAGNPSGQVDLTHPTDEQLRDPKVRAAVKRRQEVAGGIQIGSHWDQPAKA